MGKKFITFIILIFFLNVVPILHDHKHLELPDDFKHDDYCDVFNQYNNLKTYTSEIEMVIRNKFTSNSYKLKEFYKKPNLYRIDYIVPEGNEVTSKYIWKEDGIFLKSKHQNGTIKLQDLKVPQRNFIMICDFFDNFYKNNNKNFDIKNDVSGKKLKLEIKLGINKHRDSQILMIDKKTFLPISLTTYNANQESTIILNYLDFKLNENLEDYIFDV